ncbi:MAG: SRPBCC domain-containing protein, partial [Pseudomonadota bacterium]
MRRLVAAIILGIQFFPVESLHAEVMDSADDGFHLKIIVEVDVPRGETYRQFLRVGEWWNSDHTWFGDAKNMYIEPVAGGCFCEVDGGQSVLHMLVSFVRPGRTIRMLGGLGPLQEMGLQGVMTFQFDDIDGGGTRVTHEYRVTGYAKGGLKGLAPVVDQVQRDQVQRLKARLESP